MPVYRYLRRFRAFLFGLAGSCDLCTTTLYPGWISESNFQHGLHAFFNEPYIFQADTPFSTFTPHERDFFSVSDQALDFIDSLFSVVFFKGPDSIVIIPQNRLYLPLVGNLVLFLD